MSHRFWKVVFSFLFDSRNYFLLYPLISSIANWSFNSVLYSLQVFKYFLWCLLFSIASIISLWSDNIWEFILIFLHLLRLVLYAKIQYILEKVPWVAEKMCILRLFGGIFYRYLLCSLDLSCHLILVFLLIIYLDDLLLSAGYWNHILLLSNNIFV
jgi:hypothetical protein